MGNSNTKESRADPATDYRQTQAAYVNASSSRDTHSDRPSSRRQSRFGRAELSLLGLGAAGSSSVGSREDAPYERRETRQEREARRLERDRVAREKERERSMKEEHVDGGYLVTLGTYTGPEDFSKSVVRQLQIDRRLAPFWRGLNDYSDNWTEYQLICAGRGLPIPAADEQPPPEFIPQASTPASPTESSQNLANLTVPMGPRSLSVGSDRSGSGPGSGISSPNAAQQQQRSSSPFKPRAKALAAALSGSSRNTSAADAAPREIKLPLDPYVNGQPLEVFLYKDATECPICFLTYPPYLNRTRCCDQPICSECFVQIKRADPHYPEHHGEPNEQPNPEESPEMLISEPATCPYCQQTEFGVTYDAPPFRRGLSHAISTYPSQGTAMSSQTSLNSTLSPTSPTSGRRRAQSLSANAPNVITTDRVRPDWLTKLNAQRAHQARRAAAATALHTAAFLMGNNEQQRGFAFTRPGRFSRRNTGSHTPSGPSTSTTQIEVSPNRNAEAEAGQAGPEPGPRSSSGRGPLAHRRSRMEELEDMMIMEAVRLSLAAEEERKRKQEKADRKDAKKKEKEERKAQKAQAKQDRHSVYGTGQSSASGSSLSLGLGRRRGNSTTSNLRVEATVQGAQSTSAGGSAETSPIAAATSGSAPTSASTSAPNTKGKAVERPPVETQSSESSFQSASSTPSLPIPAPSRGPSHLRQMSNASSIASSLADSNSGSFTNPAYLDPRASELSVGGRSDEGDRDNTEPLYNFRSLAEMVGVDIDNGEANKVEDETTSGEAQSAGTKKKADAEDEPEAEQIEDAHVEQPVQTNAGTLKPPPTIPEEPTDGASRDDVSSGNEASTPEVTITPVTPAPGDDDSETKRLGHENVVERSSQITQ
ncbi:Protein SIP5 [Colletotrichum plurivorum]|uniref:Protein SIP5 n=1 Tax=Colletotrichum plurivorum TaxID=2175906 RepID=A0A8H6KNR6_9PEZI|nr:Protein SIP5 [Colletotrichum plurivorum]